MNLSPALQQEIEKIATSQGISSEQFILQTLTSENQHSQTANSQSVN